MNDNQSQSLPLITDDHDKQLRKRLYQMGIDNQIISKNMLQVASNNISINTEQFKIYLKKLYEVKKENDSSFEYNEKDIISKEFDTISSHISDFIRESSNSSIFERADKIKIMNYIKTAIDNAEIDENERKQLIEQYKYASSTLKQSIGTFDKTTALFVRHIGSFTGLIGSIFTDLPPITTFLMTRGGDFISNLLERRKTKKERLASLQYDIDDKKNNELHEINIARPSLFEQNNNNLQNQVQQSVNDNLSTLFTTNNNDKLERIRKTSGSLIDKAPIGTENDPFYAIIKNNNLSNEKQKSYSLLEVLGGITSKFDKLISSITSFIGKSSLLKMNETIADKAIDSLDNEVDLNDEKQEKKQKKKKRKSSRKKSKLKRKNISFKQPIVNNAVKKGSSGIIKRAASSALRVGSKLLGPIGIVLTAADILSFLNSAVSDKLEEAKKQGIKVNESIANSDSSDDMMDNAIEMSKKLSEKSKIKKENIEDNGLIKQSKDLPRDSLNNQIISTEKAREKMIQEKALMQLNTHNTNNTNMINTINQNTTQNMNRVIQVTNPQAGLVNGSR